MKKALIMTLFGEYNFGNRLQNYAVQEFLKRNNLEVETVKYLGINDDVPVTDNDIQKLRLKKFKKFNENIKFAEEPIYKEYDVPENFSDKYDYVVMGSDQIWNFTFDTIFSEKALGSFAPFHKKLSLAASFGINYTPEEGTPIYEMYKKYLNDIKSISVREFAGKEIIKNITNRDDVEVLVDPTMLIDVKDWKKVMKKPENLKTDKFILKTFLGNNSENALNELKRVAEENGCEIIDISDKNSPYYCMGPSEFLYLEKNAFLVATDSFHASVFSILFSTPFVVFKRDDNRLENMHSRIETLLKIFKMENRIFTGKITQDLLSADYTEAYKQVEIERERADRFIKKALE